MFNPIYSYKKQITKPAICLSSDGLGGNNNVGDHTQTKALEHKFFNKINQSSFKSNKTKILFNNISSLTNQVQISWDFTSQLFLK